LDFLAFLMPGERRPRPLASEAVRLATRKRTGELLLRATTRLDGLLALLAADDPRDAALLATLAAEDIDAAATLLALPSAGECGEARATLGLLPSPDALAVFAGQAGDRLAGLRRAFDTRLAGDWRTAEDRYTARALWRARTALIVGVVLLAGAILLGDSLARKGRQFAAVVVLERQRDEAADALADLAELARKAKVLTGRPLMAITGRNCSLCGCEGRDLRKMPQGDVCRRQWKEALDRLGKAAGATDKTLARLASDPWGSPYLLNENEGESPDLQCLPDTVASAGQNGLFGDGDDITVSVENVLCPK